MPDEIAMATTGRMKAACSERRSATYPMRVGEGTSPRRWKRKMLTAMAVARMWEPTELTSAVLRGEVFSRSKNAATAMAGTIQGPLVNNAKNITGMAPSQNTE